MKLLIENWRKHLKEALEVRPAMPGEMEATEAGAEPFGSDSGDTDTNEASDEQPLDAAAYLIKIKGGDLDAWNGLRNAMEGDMSGLPPDLMDEAKARELVLDLADLMAGELSGKPRKAAPITPATGMDPSNYSRMGDAGPEEYGAKSKR